MVERRADGTLRQTASMRDLNWMKPNPERRRVETELYVELGRQATDEEVDERLGSTSTEGPDA